MFEYCSRCQENPSYGQQFCRACQKDIDAAFSEIGRQRQANWAKEYASAQLERADREAARLGRISEHGEPWGFAAAPRRTPGANLAAFLVVVALVSIALLVFT
jgi:hypothetical protein